MAACSEPYIPQKTLAEMSSSHPPGTRHAAMFQIAMPLLGNGMAPEAVRAQLRATFPDADKTDKEIADVVNWCLEKNPTPSGYGAPAVPPARQRVEYRKPEVLPKVSPREKMSWWLNGATATVESVISSSPHLVPSQRELSAGCLLRNLFLTTEYVNIVRAYTVNDKGKANPQGAGKAMHPQDWELWIAEHGMPEDKAGAWMRFNPTTERGTGAEGAVKDADITAFRFMMIESDVLSLEQQLAFYRRCKLPIAAIIQSGGDSAHAWVHMDCADDATYTEAVARVLASLEPFGFDRANKNPSRLSRLPGAQRTIGAKGDGVQRLLYLDPQAKAMDAEAFSAFELHLKLPLVSERPFRQIITSAVHRYIELELNKGKSGVPTGITDFDAISGGLKPGQMIVIAAQTGGGKTTLATNIINTAAWHNNIGVALFTLEMDRHEICDLLVSLNCGVNRNVFNNGNFSMRDMAAITAHLEQFNNLPLWISDEPVMTVEQIRLRVLQLKAENKIGLVVVDYLQFVSGGESFRDNREQQIAAISRGLRSLAKEAKIPVIALSQLNDEGKLRESRVIAHDAHIVILVEEIDSGDMMVKVVKGRSIPKGEYLMRFHRELGRLEPVKMTQREPYCGHPNARKSRHH
jgi:KaiC/GvpD/RAD55 family RecA-like ATPase